MSEKQRRDIGEIRPRSGTPSKRLRRYVNLQLAANGLPPAAGADDELRGLAGGLLAKIQERDRLLSDHRCPVDQRIEAFLERYFADLELEEPLRLPGRSLELDRHGVARELSLPAHGDRFSSALVESFRVRNGVLHNPRNDRRTTQGTFHVTAGGLPVPAVKKEVPKQTFAALFRRAVSPPATSMRLPFTSEQKEQAETFVSLLLRPLVCPEVPGFTPERSMEIRFFAPGGFVSNLDFVESIFGNAGDPNLPENDAGLDVVHWTGHTGCVIVAPHLTGVRKVDLGLPHHDAATERERRDGMCWTSEDEIYNDGVPFKITCRDERGVMVTLISDNYFGYCKKEVKTQINYAANLMGDVEEEHAGGAIAFRSYNLGEQYTTRSFLYNRRTIQDVVRDYPAFVDPRPEGYAIDRNWPDLVYVPETTTFDLPSQRVYWVNPDGSEGAIKLLPERVYMTPSGYKVHMEKHPGAPSWRLIGTVGEGVFCHKPCTVSGGGKSEISKSLSDYMLYGPFFVSDVQSDLDLVEEIVNKDYMHRWRPGRRLHPERDYSRPLLSPDRSVGSVIKLLTPSPIDYTDEYNAWLETIPNYVLALVFVIKRFYRPEWGDSWRQYFGVDIVNGFPGHELKFGARKLVGSYLRLGFRSPTEWRTFKLRQDFNPATKIQMEDDISASVVVPRDRLAGLGSSGVPAAPSVKLVENCEFRLFQRPDDAIHRGLDKQTERDLSSPGNFLSNFEPLPTDVARDMVDEVTTLEEYTEPMKQFVRECAELEDGLFVASSQPRLIDGKPSKNPRYLQTRPDLVDPMKSYVSQVGIRLNRSIPAKDPVHVPVDAVLFGRRNNPPEPGIRPLCVYNPIHYQELPELFMDFIASLTGKSPSTTGAGSEGALTKGPFNALRQLADLNNALVSFILTGLHGFSTAAGYIGPQVRVDHDISLLVPEIWCRLAPEERDPHAMIRAGLLERLEDFDHEGERVLASRLGYRITYRFVRAYFGRVFDNPNKVCDDEILKPETQDREVWIDGIRNICDAHRRVAREYLADDSVEDACPPLRALLHIMAEGQWDGKDVHDPAVRSMFTLEHLLASDWYGARIDRLQRLETELWQRHVGYLRAFLDQEAYEGVARRLAIESRLDYAMARLEEARDGAHRERLRSCLGADLIGPY